MSKNKKQRDLVGTIGMWICIVGILLVVYNLKFKDMLKDSTPHFYGEKAIIQEFMKTELDIVIKEIEKTENWKEGARYWAKDEWFKRYLVYMKNNEVVGVFIEGRKIF